MTFTTLVKLKTEVPRELSVLGPFGLEDAGPEEILEWALEKWSRRVALVTSFQVEGLVLLDMAWRIDPTVRVITLDTGRLPSATYDVIDRVRDQYGIEVETYFPDGPAVEALVNKGGPNLFYRSVQSRLDCCHVRKVEPLIRALSGLDAWVTGLRRSQGAARVGIDVIEIDQDHGGIAKLNPLAKWSRRQVAAYAREHDVPEHPLYARGYASIGCEPCTRPIQAGEDERAGRWWWESGGHKECGLHGLRSDGSIPASRRGGCNNPVRRGQVGGG